MKSNFKILVPEGAKLDPYRTYTFQVILISNGSRLVGEPEIQKWEKSGRKVAEF